MVHHKMLGAWVRAACWALVPVYVLFVSYCALVPFDQWDFNRPMDFQRIFVGWQNHILTFDIIQNLLLYIPFGFFLVFAFKTKRIVTPLLLTFGICLLVSFILECMQSFIPVRVPSALDIVLNTLSGVLGALIALILYKPIMDGADYLVHDMMRPFSMNKPYSFMAVIGLLGWCAYQWYPFIPSLHPDHILQGYAMLAATLAEQRVVDVPHLIWYLAQGLGIYTLCLIAFKKQQALFALSYLAMVLSFKILIISRVLSFEALIGALLGFVIAFTLHMTFQLAINEKKLLG